MHMDGRLHQAHVDSQNILDQHKEQWWGVQPEARWFEELIKDEQQVMRRRSWPIGPFVANRMNNKQVFIASMWYDELVVAADKFVADETNSDQ